MKNDTNRTLSLPSICRVSSHEQSEGYSLDMQDQANREWAKRKGYTIVDTIRYVETASKQKERQRFHEIMNGVCSNGSRRRITKRCSFPVRNSLRMPQDGSASA